MTSDRNIERLLDHWFTERPTEVADRVLDEVADRIGRQPQQPAWRVIGRDSHVTSYIKPLLAVAAVVVIAVAGIGLLGRPSDPGVGGPASANPSSSATATPSPSTAPSTDPSESADFPEWYSPEPGSGGAGTLASGSQTTRSFKPAFTFSVPDGWVNPGDSADFFGLFPDTAANRAENARSGGLAQNIYMGPIVSPWFVCDGLEENVGATAADLVASVVGNEALATSEPVDVTIGGLTGKQVDVRLNPDWTGGCPTDDDDSTDLADYRVRGILLDTPDRGVIVIFVDSLSSADFEPFVAEAMPIVESFEFDLSN